MSFLDVLLILNDIPALFLVFRFFAVNVKLFAISFLHAADSKQHSGNILASAFSRSCAGRFMPSSFACSFPSFAFPSIALGLTSSSTLRHASPYGSLTLTQGHSNVNTIPANGRF
jgi:hypothetical protein